MRGSGGYVNNKEEYPKLRLTDFELFSNLGLNINSAIFSIAFKFA